jgi:hypothetical protein
MLRIFIRAMAIGCIIVTAACGGDDKNSTGPGSGGSSSHGTLTASIDGVAYTGIVNTATLVNNTINVASNSADLTRSVSFALSNAAVGTINVATSPVQMSVITTNGTTTTGSWIASFGIGSGTLTIASLSSSGASGTFSFTAPPATATTPAGNKVVTNGAFNVTF